MLTITSILRTTDTRYPSHLLTKGKYRVYYAVIGVDMAQDEFSLLWLLLGIGVLAIIVGLPVLAFFALIKYLRRR